MIRNILNRTSVRDYLSKAIEIEKIETLKKIINSSPTSMNTQEFSAIFLTNPELKEKISKLNWNQSHIKDAPLLIIFLADFNRVDYAAKKCNVKCSIPNIEKLTLASVDATIAAGLVCASAGELGLSTCFVGGIRNYADEIAAELKLEGNCTPIVALVIGYAKKESALRPKVNKIYDNTYSLDKVHGELEEYDEVMKKYYQDIVGRELSWTKATADGMCGNKLNTTRRERILTEQFFK